MNTEYPIEAVDTESDEESIVGRLAVTTAERLMRALISDPPELPNPTVRRIAELIAAYSNADGLLYTLRLIAKANDSARMRALALEAIATVDDDAPTVLH
jgi:hypothetical protein